MERIINAITPEHRQDSLDFVETVFREYQDVAEGRLVRSLVEEIRSKPFYVPDLELIMTDEGGRLLGYVMFSRFELEGRYGDELLLLSPAAVRTDLQRQHISRELIEYGFREAERLGFRAVLVEGGPCNYRARGFVTAADHGILPGKTVHLPHIDCLMVKELVPGALEHIHGTVEYDCYQALL